MPTPTTAQEKDTKHILTSLINWMLVHKQDIADLTGRTTHDVYLAVDAIAKLLPDEAE